MEMSAQRTNVRMTSASTLSTQANAKTETFAPSVTGAKREFVKAERLVIARTGWLAQRIPVMPRMDGVSTNRTINNVRPAPLVIVKKIVSADLPPFSAVKPVNVRHPMPPVNAARTKIAGMRMFARMINVRKGNAGIHSTPPPVRMTNSAQRGVGVKRESVCRAGTGIVPTELTAPGTVATNPKTNVFTAPMIPFAGRRGSPGKFVLLKGGGAFVGREIFFAFLFSGVKARR